MEFERHLSIAAGGCVGNDCSCSAIPCREDFKIHLFKRINSSSVFSTWGESATGIKGPFTAFPM